MENIDETRDELEKILSEREYQVYFEDNRSFIEKWWDNIKEWIMEQLSKVFSSLEPTNGLADAVLFFIVAVLIGLLILALFLWIRSVNRKRKFHEHKPLYSVKEIDWTYQQHLSEAESQEGNEDYRKATRHLFLSILLYLNDKEWLEAKVWKTNLEYVEELRKINKNHALSFYQLAQFFDEVVYGEREINQSEYVEFKELAHKLWQLEELEA
ncbi:DUF4129 domain-containing protein [Ornithinibacillus halophilus]|uniref:DUF4129 domain-containing protein n=1 Tax=Ornithinibacillus halophilus TaxID=930117 RepID=UPI00093308FD|nr:DUF4129 domain-containing protein [Ornithinibacillus halophilus]